MIQSFRGAAPVMALAAVALSLATAGAQDTPHLRALVSDFAAPAIDRGIRDNDPVRRPNTEATARLDRTAGRRLLPYAPGSLIVKFRPGTSAAAQRAILGLIDATRAPALSDASFDVVSIARDSNPEAAADRLSMQADVEYAQARYRMHEMFVPNDPFYSRQWNFPAIDMERAWDINPGASPSITVAVTDSGVAYLNAIIRYNAQAFQAEQNGPVFPALGTIDVPFAAAPDLAGTGRFVAPHDFIWGDDTPVDLDGHGTHVSGTIGQLTNNGLGVAGMAFNVKIMPVKVIDTDWDQIFGSPFEGTDDTVARGVRYAADNGAKIINMSIGRTGPPAPVMQDAITYAVGKGAFVVVAAGNEYDEGNPVERLAEFAPKIDGMVAVGAVGRDLRRAFYSSTGPFVELTAPGGDARSGGGAAGAILQQTYDFDLTETFLRGPSQYHAPRFDSFAYQFFQGTSMAAPHVSGFAALLMQQGITSPAAIEAAMKKYAKDLGASGRDDEYGYGLIQPRDTLRGMGLLK